ncbi:MAG: hypothetical protein PHT22_03835 [Bacteroidales bacterium]|nr:hypothetical protein [Bacteroidales bacterium]
MKQLIKLNAMKKVCILLLLFVSASCSKGTPEIIQNADNIQTKSGEPYLSQVDGVESLSFDEHVKILLDRIPSSIVYSNVRIFKKEIELVSIPIGGWDEGDEEEIITFPSEVVSWYEWASEYIVVDPVNGNRYSEAFSVPNYGTWRLYVNGGYALDGSSVIGRTPEASYVIQVVFNSGGISVSWPQDQSWCDNYL